MPHLVAEGVNAGYGSLQVLFDVDMEVRDGEITVIVGPNGSGKSTMLKTIFRLTSLYSGKITFDGIDLTNLKPHEVARVGIAYLSQVENVFPHLTVRENLLMASYTVPRDEVESRMAEVLELFPILKEYMGSKAMKLSGGERQMLAIAMALIRHPKLMMFDEPTANLAPKIARTILGQIVQLRDTHDMTIVLVEQNAKRALEIGDSAYLFVAGRPIFSGSAKELLSHPDLGRLYLGIYAPMT